MFSLVNGQATTSISFHMIIGMVKGAKSMHIYSKGWYIAKLKERGIRFHPEKKKKIGAI